MWRIASYSRASERGLNFSFNNYRSVIKDRPSKLRGDHCSRIRSDHSELCMVGASTLPILVMRASIGIVDSKRLGDSVRIMVLPTWSKRLQIFIFVKFEFNLWTALDFAGWVWERLWLFFPISIWLATVSPYELWHNWLTCWKSVADKRIPLCDEKCKCMHFRWKHSVSCGWIKFQPTIVLWKTPTIGLW